MKILIPLTLLITILTAGFSLSQNSRNPHGPLQWDCQACHTTDSWTNLRSDMAFDHDETGFRLTGAHRQADCAGCHQSPVFSHVSTACLDCHTDHHQGQLGVDCSDCHTPRDWQPRQDLLLKHAERGFPLTGVHAVADCESCHHSRDRQEYVGTPTACESCHQEALRQAADPDHQQLAFQNDCEQCHHAAFGSWTQTTYDHPATFPLTGAHRTLDCSTCHSAGFSGTPGQCYDCHSAAYATTTNPNHQQSNFATTCADCHSTSAWVPATFDHATTGFPLIGRHAGATCVSCHPVSYAGTPSNCYACHQSDYDATSDPSHTAAQFPTDCEPCHTPNGWTPAAWDHDGQYFPIYSGSHAGKWSNCSECHTVPGNFTAFDCTACHEHNRTDTDADHREVNNYQYLSSACYDCHPRGTK